MLDSKLTIKPFLNKRLKCKDDKFLLYARITYNRKSNELPYKNLVFNSDMNISQHPYKYNKDFLFNDDEFLKNQDKFITELYDKIEPIMVFLSRQGKDDLSLLPSVISKLNKPLIKILKHLLNYRFDKIIQEKILNLVEDKTPKEDLKHENLDDYIMKGVESLTVAIKAVQNEDILCYDFIIKKDVINFISMSKYINFAYDNETYNNTLKREITDYLISQ